MNAIRTVIVLVAFLGFVPSALAWEGTKTCYPTGIYRCETGEVSKQVRWTNRCVGYEINELGSEQLPREPDGKISQVVVDTITASFDTWNQVGCSDLSFVYVGTTTENAAEFDRELGCEGNTNLVVFQDDAWPPADASAFAITSVTFDPKSGLITDADIELNTATHDFTIGDDNIIIDLRNTITHEAGHFLGLDHSPVRDSTMFFSAAEGESKKRDLEDDDTDAVCTIYPTLVENRVCANPPPCNAPDISTGTSSGCCSSVDNAPPARSPWLLLVGLAAVYGLRRRATSTN